MASGLCRTASLVLYYQVRNRLTTLSIDWRSLSCPQGSTSPYIWIRPASKSPSSIPVYRWMGLLLPLRSVAYLMAPPATATNATLCIGSLDLGFSQSHRRSLRFVMWACFFLDCFSSCEWRHEWFYVLRNPEGLAQDSPGHSLNLKGNNIEKDSIEMKYATCQHKDVPNRVMIR